MSLLIWEAYLLLRPDDDRLGEVVTYPLLLVGDEDHQQPHQVVHEPVHDPEYVPYEGGGVVARGAIGNTKAATFELEEPEMSPTGKFMSNPGPGVMGAILSAAILAGGLYWTRS